MVRRRGTDAGSMREVGSCGTALAERTNEGQGGGVHTVSSASSSSLDTLIVIALDAAANRLR